MDYQKTLNLPKTDFSMRAELARKEPTFLERWEQEGLYAKIREKSQGKTPFILHDGPPYANGNIHIGHALNKILKDMIVKYKTMRGYNSFYLPGWDCHGLPIEHQLLKEMKQKKGEVDCLPFRKKAHDYAMKYVGIQKEQFKRLGVFGEWDHPYLTLSPEYEYWILKSLATLNEKGYIYRGLKPVNWCFHCETALAEAEVEYEDHTSPSIYVKFKVNNPEVVKGLPRGKDSFLLVWTTTPWTLIANVAVAVHPLYQYKFVDDPEQGILIMEDSLVPTVKWRKKGSHPRILARVDGRALEGISYVHPFGIKDRCRVIVADYVTKEEGTGLVHIAPGHGQEDFEVGLVNHLDIVMPVDDRGIFTREAGAFEGQHVFKANGNIISDLQARGTLFAAENITHSYPHCWRCKNPIIFRATQQWFLKIDHKDLRRRLKEVIEQHVQWIPPSGKERIWGMVVGRPDWCLSRQRHWGVPIPALECQGCHGEHKLFTVMIEHFANVVKSEGSDIWFEKDLPELIPEGFRCPDCGQSEFTKTKDILDVWFDSGVSHQAVVKAMMGYELPIDLYLEGSDQHRGWFQSSLIPAMAIENKPPFKIILTHGFVVDGQGRKMSKSLGNVISPLDLIKNSGADIVRLWVASSSYSEDVRISNEILERLTDAYRKIRNTMRFLLGNLYDFNPVDDVLAYEDLEKIDRWALYRLALVMEEIEHFFDDYEFAKIYKSIYTFCNEDLSSFYLDILKDRLYTAPSYSQQRRSAQTVLFHILNHLVRALAPLLSFTAEEIFGAMPKEAAAQEPSSVHVLEWLDIPEIWKDKAITDEFKPLVVLRPHVLKALEEKRRLGEIGSSLEAKVVFHTASPRELVYLRQQQSILPAALIVSQVEVQESKNVRQGLGEEFAQTDIVIQKADGQKCSRCWNFRTDVGHDPQHTTLCRRCTENIKEFV